MIDVYFDAAVRLFGFAVKLLGKAFDFTVQLAKEIALSLMKALGTGVRAGYETLKESSANRPGETPGKESRSQNGSNRRTQTSTRQNQREHSQKSRERHVDAPFQSSKAQKVGQWYSLLYLAGMNPDGTGIAHVVKTYRDAKAAIAARAAEPHLLVHKSSGPEPKYGTPIAVRLTDQQQVIQRAQEARTTRAQANSLRSVQQLQKAQRIGPKQSHPRQTLNP